ncbi:hypothetical protein [Nonomuraea sp. NPDC049141]|uniref:hypothetical protein n=1 Tax=Nonomuraea sp. NPDC049141 TaxID=3155500 RepID=UPI0033F43803
MIGHKVDQRARLSARVEGAYGCRHPGPADPEAAAEVTEEPAEAVGDGVDRTVGEPGGGGTVSTGEGRR